MDNGYNYTSVADLVGACMGAEAASPWKSLETKIFKKTFTFCCVIVT